MGWTIPPTGPEGETVFAMISPTSPFFLCLKYFGNPVRISQSRKLSILREMVVVLMVEGNLVPSAPLVLFTAPLTRRPPTCEARGRQEST